ncbi:MAG: ribosomal protein S18-alanine N-acetyltransferase [Desulfobacterales bacterium]|nr:ribosomal protein S18-alanine N-acetyltransferase [Desulfobacterales bacterium]
MWTLDAITEADIDPLLAIERDLFEHPWTQRALQDELACKDAFNFILKHTDSNGGERIAGYICLRLFAGELHILKLAVAQVWRRRGIASWLLEKTIPRALEKGADEAFLEVRASNESAIRLYSKLGFHIVGKRTNYYPGPGGSGAREDALIMKKNLEVQT